MSVNKGKKPIKGFNQLSAQVSSFADLVDDNGLLVNTITPHYNKNNAQDAVNSAPEHMLPINEPTHNQTHHNPVILTEKEVFKVYGEWVKDPSFVFDQVMHKVKLDLASYHITIQENIKRYDKFLLCYHEQVNNIENAWYRETEVSRLKAAHILDHLVFHAKNNLYLNEAESLNNVLQAISEKHELYIAEQEERIKNINALLAEKENIINNQTSQLEELNNLHKKASEANKANANNNSNYKKRPQSQESQTYTTTEKVVGGVIIGAVIYGAYSLLSD